MNSNREIEKKLIQAVQSFSRRQKLDSLAKERVGHYVYLLINPLSLKVFYIGRGVNNRFLSHFLEAVRKSNASSTKLKEILSIFEGSQEPLVEILRSKLTEKEAIEVEAAAIELVGFKLLSNAVLGFHSGKNGRMSVSEFSVQYGAKKIKVENVAVPAVLLKVSRQWYRNMPASELHEATRKCWRISKSIAPKIKYVFAMADGIVRVYAVDGWTREGRADGKPGISFTMHVDATKVGDSYRNCSVSDMEGKSGRRETRYSQSVRTR